MSTLKYKFRTEISIENGVKWIRHYLEVSGDAYGYPHHFPPAFYFSTYKCDRCGCYMHIHSNINPLHDIRCQFAYCGNPSLLFFLWRELTGQKLSGIGRLIEVKVRFWEWKC